MKNTILNRSLLICSLCFIVSTAHAQYVALPDTNFGTWLNQNGWSSCVSGNNVTGWQLDTLAAQSGTVCCMYCAGAGIHDLTGVQYFSSVFRLDCSYNELTTINAVPSGLYEFFCDHNHLTHLQINGLSSLQILYCNSNNLDSITSLPTSLTILNCDSNNLTLIPSPDPNSYYNFLSCSYNRLDTITPQIYFGNANTGPPYFACSHNLLRSMPNATGFNQFGFTYVDCSYNQITSIDYLWQGTLFNCSHNLLTGDFTAGGDTVDCSNNNLTSIPSYAFASSLNCSGNNLLTLPNLPQTLSWLNCSRNNLTSLPPLPDSLRSLDCHSNKELFCLPLLHKTLDTLYIDSTSISCMPNRIHPHGFDIDPALLPLCTPASGCDFYYIISGNVHSDVSATCTQDSLSPGSSIRNVKVQLIKAGNVAQEIYTSNTGEYTFGTDSMGSYIIEIDTLTLPFSVACPSSGASSVFITANDTVDITNNFGLVCSNADYEVLNIASVLAHPFRYNIVTPIDISIGNVALTRYNAQCLGSMSGVVSIFYSGAVHYAGPAPGALVPSFVFGDTLIYNISNLDSISQGNFGILFNTDNSGLVGSAVCISSIVTPTTPDVNPEDDTLIQCFTIHDSNDPNLKEVYPIAAIDTGLAQWLTYTVHFQNTGNDTAYIVVVKDTLSQYADASTFQYLASSHKAVIQLFGNAMIFTFPKINLVDSATNPPLSEGWIQYKVKTKPNLAVGTQIKNTGYIYFDSNPAVVTNTTTNTVSLSYPLGVISTANNNLIHLYPNPNKGIFNLQTSNSISSDYTISDMLGHVIAQHMISADTQQVDMSAAADGVYTLAIRGAQPVRFVVMR